jgi:GNAT superfamily N-acetyltransferase
MIKELVEKDLEKALKLVEVSFMKYVAPLYSKEGINTFLNFIEISSVKNRLNEITFYGYYIEDLLVGVLALKPNHVSLLFIDDHYFKRGIATQLLDACLKGDVTTVNSSPYAKAFYKKYGFTQTDEEQLKDGIKYIPMQLKRK